MMRNKSTRVLATLGVTVSLALAAMAGPASISAARALIATGGGTTPGTNANGATPPAVSLDKVAGFYVWAKNNDAANLSSFFMNVKSDAKALGAYWWRSNDTTPHSCGAVTTSHPLQCDFGAFNSGQDVIVLAAFKLPTEGSIANCDPAVPQPATSHVCVDFKFGANSGFVPGKNNSRGDEYHHYESVATIPTTGDRAAQFPFCDVAVEPCAPSLLLLNNGTNVGRNNVQNTAVEAPFAAFNSVFGTTGIAVQDNFEATFNCDAFVTLTACNAHEAAGDFLGQWSQADVNSDDDFAAGDWVEVTITMYGVSVSKIDGVLHLWTSTSGDPPIVVQHEDELTRCASAAGPNDDTPAAGCFWAVSGAGNTAIVHIWSDNNGKYHTF